MVAAEFNEMVTGRLVEGALSAFRSHGVGDDDLTVVWVPGAFELPLAARRLAANGLYDARRVPGRGGARRDGAFRLRRRPRPHAASRTRRSDTGVPVLFGVLTTETMEQALDRAGGKHGNKGWDAAMAAMQMASVPRPDPEKG